jgi:hypothetical protein
MVKITLYTGALFSTLMGAQVFAEPPTRDVNVVSIPTVKVVGLTDQTSTGRLMPSERHARCAETFPGSHWCNSEEIYLVAEDAPLPEYYTAWVQPFVRGAYYNPIRDERRLVTAQGAGWPPNVDCFGWQSDEFEDEGMALQRIPDRSYENVRLEHCNLVHPSLCCASVLDE